MGKTEATNDDGDGDDTRPGKRKGEFPASKGLIASADRDKIKKDGNSVEQDPAVWDGYLTRLSSPAQPGLVRPVFKQPGLWVVFGGVPFWVWVGAVPSWPVAAPNFYDPACRCRIFEGVSVRGGRGFLLRARPIPKLGVVRQLRGKGPSTPSQAPSRARRDGIELEALLSALARTARLGTVRGVFPMSKTRQENTYYVVD
ncbi:hypothetical protein BKA56DRAFT_613341 [Ilyonectria sp. MPI-CAGE-AT-0026]|nr:hypothetical protein BKA56DRAFT_613341 [Ilyonectria sp. MPI-CAGE-AT-0026]